MYHHWSAASVFFALAFVFPLVSIVHATPFRRPDVHSSADRGKFPIDGVTQIHIFHVLDGQKIKTVVSKSQLPSGPAVVDGYVTGIVVFCGEEMEVSLEGRRFAKLSNNGDGSFSAKYFGRLTPGTVRSRIGKNTYFEKPETAQPVKSTRKPFRAGYSLFPQVTGNAVSARQVLELKLETEGEQNDIAIKQEGFEHAALGLGGSGAGPRAVYIGTRLAALKSEISDFHQRCEAIRKGIARVEKMLGRDLVSKFILLDYADIQNAITCENSDDIWFYIETFRNEPVPELETIAAHEAIHKYVDQKDFTRSSDLRKWFSDLKGHDLFSMERFLLLTQGMLPADAGTSESENSLFFAFIDERNFLEDRKGGHSRDNLDEFCTSFIHAALNAHRLEANLDRRILLHDDTEAFLSEDEKQAMLSTFRKVLAVFRGVTDPNEPAEKFTEQSVFTEGMAIAGQVQDRLNRRVTTAACD